jgi:RNA polymerase sigma-70 factor (ECF subfamily)
MNQNNETTNSGAETNILLVSKNSPEYLELLRLKRNEQSKISKQKKKEAAIKNNFVDKPISDIKKSVDEESPESLELLRIKRNEYSRLYKQKKRDEAKDNNNKIVTTTDSTILIDNKIKITVENIVKTITKTNIEVNNKNIEDTSILNKSNSQLETLSTSESVINENEIDDNYEVFNSYNNKNKNLENEFFQKTGLIFNSFYKTYYPKLYWYILKIVKDPDQAKDVVNVAFMQSLNKIDSYNPEYNFSTWLFNIAQKYAFTYLKEKSKFLSVDEKDENGNTLLNYFESKIEDKEVEDNQIIITKYNYMLKQIELLPEKYKNVITMRELDNLSYDEINEYLGIGLQNVKNQIRNGRLLLQKMTKEYFEKIDKTM